MDLSGIIFLLIGFIAIMGGYVLEGGGHLEALKHLIEITALLIVIGGTVSAVGLSFPSHVIKRLPKVIKVAFAKKHNSSIDTIITISKFSNKARRGGILSLEEEIKKQPDLDPFLTKGLNLVIDGTDPQLVKSILEIEIDSMSARHKAGAGIFESAGGFGPTMGIIGTVMGLVHVLGNLSDPNSLGPKIAVAFIATLYGVFFANIVYLPIASRLKELHKEEVEEKLMIMDGVFSILEGESPTILVSKLKGYLNAEDKIKLEEKMNKNKDNE